MSLFFPNESITLYANFLDENASPVMAGVSGVTVDIYSQNPAKAYLVSGATMTQDPVQSNIWFYNYIIPYNTNITNYHVIYNATYSGTYVQNDESIDIFNFNAAGISGTLIIPGNTQVSGTTVDMSGNTIPNIAIMATNGNALAGGSVTDASGNFLMLLNDSTTYYFTASSPNYSPTTRLIDIPYSSGNFYAGTFTMIPTNAAQAITISDTYVWTDSYQHMIPLPNLKVSIYMNDRPAGDPPVAIAYTNTSGTFFVTIIPDSYVMDVEGQYWNGYKYDRYEMSYNIEVNPIWSGTQGSSAVNFVYSSTSKYNYLG